MRRLSSGPLNPGYTGKAAAADGSPAIDSVPPDSVHIDWNGIVNGGLIKPTIVLPGGSWPTAALADTNYYPVIRVNGDFSLPS